MTDRQNKSNSSTRGSFKSNSTSWRKKPQQQKQEWQLKETPKTARPPQQTSTGGMDPFSVLPLDVLVYIVELANHKSWLRLSLVSKSFYLAINKFCYSRLDKNLSWHILFNRPSLPPSFNHDDYRDASSLHLKPPNEKHPNRFLKSQYALATSIERNHKRTPTERSQPYLFTGGQNYLPKLRLTNQNLVSSFGHYLYNWTSKYSIDSKSNSTNKSFQNGTLDEQMGVEWNEYEERNASKLARSGIMLHKIQSPHKGDITDFQVYPHDPLINNNTNSSSNDWILSSSVDSSVKIWNRRTGDTRLSFEGHKDHVQCVDFNHSSLICSGSFDESVRIWSAASGACISSLTLGDRIWSTKMNESHIAVGTTGFSSSFREASHLYSVDIESGSSDLMRGHLGSVYDLQIFQESSQGNSQKTKNATPPLPGLFLMSASYDGTVRLWDRSTLQPAISFEDPEDYPVYCALYAGSHVKENKSFSNSMESPNGDSFRSSEQSLSNVLSPSSGWQIVTGTAFHSVVRVWDIRRSKNPLYNIYVNKNRQGKGIVVYSLAMDDANLFVALSNGVYLVKYA